MNEELILSKANELAVSGELDQAFALLKPLIENRSPMALCLAGTLYQLYGNTEEQIKDSVRFLKEAIDLGEGLAAHNLGTLFVTGAVGLKSDIVLSEKYKNIAKELGCDLYTKENT